MQPQLEQTVRLLEADLRELWPQLHDMIDQQLATASRPHIPQLIPDFARQRHELLQSIQLALIERIAGKSIEEEFTHMFHEASAGLRLPAVVAAASAILALIVARSSPAIAAVTGGLAASAAVTGTIVAFWQRRKIVRAYEQEMESKRSELVNAVEKQLEHAIDQFYRAVSTASRPLADFCLAQRRHHESLLKRADELQRTLDGLKARLG